MVNNTWIILQARMNSTRLPGKVMQKINNTPLIGVLVNRIKKSGLPIILATSENKENDSLAEYAKIQNIEVFKGSEENVLERYYKAAKFVQAHTIIRITGDNPLLDGELIREQANNFHNLNNKRAYLSTGLSQTYPLGMSVEIFGFNLLEEAFNNATLTCEFEHVTPYMHQNKPGNIEIIASEMEKSKYHYRLTVDTEEDFLFNKQLIEEFHCDKLNLDEIIDVIDKHPELLKINEKIDQKNWDE